MEIEEFKKELDEYSKFVEMVESIFGRLTEKDKLEYFDIYKKHGESNKRFVCLSMGNRIGVYDLKMEKVIIKFPLTFRLNLEELQSDSHFAKLEYNLNYIHDSEFENVLFYKICNAVRQFTSELNEFYESISEGEEKEKETEGPIILNEGDEDLIKNIPHTISMNFERK